MEYIFKVDWQSVFIPSLSVAEVALRGTIIYLALFAFLRFFLKRETGVIGIADLLVVVLIADAAQNGLGSEYRSVTEGLVLVLTIIFWNFVLDWLAFRFPSFQRLMRPAPLLLIKDGQMIRQNMRKEMITKDELLSQIREQGLEDPGQVERAYMEGDGRISVIPKDKQESSGNNNKNIVT